MTTINNPTEIPGLVYWVEADSEGNPVNKLGDDCDHFFWADPNTNERGTMLKFNRRLSDEERQQVEAWLFNQYQPSMADLPTNG